MSNRAKLLFYLLFMMFGLQALANRTCERACYKNLYQVCNECRLCESCSPVTPRDFIQSIEEENFNEVFPKISSNKNMSKVLKLAKERVFKSWGINPDLPLNQSMKFPRDVILNYEDGSFDMAMNSQLARELLRSYGGHRELKLFAENYLELVKSGERVDQQFKTEFEKVFIKEKGSRSIKWSECFTHLKQLHQSSKELCFRVNKLVDRHYFKNRPFTYQVSISEFNPILQQSPSRNSSTFWSPSNEGLDTSGNQLFDCQKKVFNKESFKDAAKSACDEEKSLEVVSDHLRDIEFFKGHSSSRYFDLLRIEAIRELFLNYTNAIGDFPERDLIQKCERPFGYSLNNLYELTPEELNPDIKK